MDLNFKGWDDWDRPVYESNGRLYVDVDPRDGRGPDICTKYRNEFYGEPDVPIKPGVELNFIPERMVWR